MYFTFAEIIFNHCLRFVYFTEKSEWVQQENESVVVKESVLSDLNKSKQILGALPQELITRIKESGKRKPIPVIPPIPNKKRCSSRVQELEPKNKLTKLTNSETVQLDHDYCNLVSPYPKNPKKDSGFESAEEDDRTLLKNQPTVKNADGKLMVSLLKVNTIKSSTNNVNNMKQKRKLNLAEYKKRKEIVKIESSSHDSNFLLSPIIEDEVTRRKKHEEKLLKMSIDLLNTAPATSNKLERHSTGTDQLHNILPATSGTAVAPVPDDIEVKTYLSVATNTEIIPALPLCQEPVVEEIKPLLQNPRISTNSLIASVIENLPKVKSKNKSLLEDKTKPQSSGEHGENKTIVYLPKHRIRPQMRTVYMQTEGSPVNEQLQIMNSSSKLKTLDRKSRHRR